MASAPAMPASATQSIHSGHGRSALHPNTHDLGASSSQERPCLAFGLNIDVWAHVLCYCEARSICAFACGAAWSADVFSVRLLTSTDDVEASAFRRQWQTNLVIGDRLDAMDVEGRWFEAQVIACNNGRVDVHYRSWNSSFDQSFDRVSLRLAPLFTHCVDWRPRLKRGQFIEAKKERCWYLAIVLNVSRHADRHSRWTKLLAIGVNSTREDDTLRIVTPNVPAVDSADLLHWVIHDFDSEDIAPLGTHIRPGEAGKHYTTNNIAMPMSLMIELMTDK